MQREAMLRGEPAPEAEQAPELQALEQRLMSESIVAWADAKVPALDGKSPRQAVKSVKGRAAVTRLIKAHENQLNRNHGDTYRAAFDELRQSLGLAEE